MPFRAALASRPAPVPTPHAALTTPPDPLPAGLLSYMPILVTYVHEHTGLLCWSPCSSPFSALVPHPSHGSGRRARTHVPSAVSAPQSSLCVCARARARACRWPLVLLVCEKEKVCLSVGWGGWGGKGALVLLTFIAASTSARLSISAFTTSSWPFCEAMYSGVAPSCTGGDAECRRVSASAPLLPSPLHAVPPLAPSCSPQPLLPYTAAAAQRSTP